MIVNNGLLYIVDKDLLCISLSTSTENPTHCLYDPKSQVDEAQTVHTLSWLMAQRTAKPSVKRSVNCDYNRLQIQQSFRERDAAPFEQPYLLACWPLLE
jgi:hypothetical protein